MRTLLRAALIAALALGTELHAQQTPGAPGRPHRVAVTVALVDTLAGGAPFHILRRTNLAPLDVILLRADADSLALSAAVHELLLVRSIQGDTASTAGVVRVRPRTGTPGQTVRVLAWTQRVVNDLRGAQPQPVAGVGTVRAVQIWLPPQRGRARTR